MGNTEVQQLNWYFYIYVKMICFILNVFYKISSVKQSKGGMGVIYRRARVNAFHFKV